MNKARTNSDVLHIEIDAKRIYDDIQELKALNREMIEHQKYTNGRVTQAEEDIDENSEDIKSLNKTKWHAIGFAGGAVAAVELLFNFIL